MPPPATKDAYEDEVVSTHGAADDEYTPAQRAAFKRLAEAEKRAANDAAELAKDRKIIDRALAIRDGLIPPPWAEKLIKAASTKSNPKTRRRWQVERVVPILLKLWPPNGLPPPVRLACHKMKEDIRSEF